MTELKIIKVATPKERAIVVDTNSVNNENPEGPLFGKREVLAKISKDNRLLVPDIVLKEIYEHKKNGFTNAKRSLIKNYLSNKIANLENIQSLEFKKTLKDFINDETIRFEIISISNHAKALARMSELALAKRAPFGEKNDKGFKDALIAVSVEEFLEKNELDDRLILVSCDGRLGEFFEQNKKVTVVKNLEEAEQILKVKNDIENDSFVKESERIESSININKRAQTRRLLTTLRNSSSFKQTHEVIRELNNFKQWLTIEDKQDIIVSACSNSQIAWIMNDVEIEQFLMPIFKEIKDNIPRDLYNDFVTKSGKTSEFPLIVDSIETEIEPNVDLGDNAWFTT